MTRTRNPTSPSSAAASAACSPPTRCVAQGVSVSVYEQAPALGEIGAGVYLTPNGVRQLERVGLGPAVEKWGSLVGPHSHYLRHDGTPIAPVQVADASGWNATYGMHRADFVDFLAANLPAGHRPLPATAPSASSRTPTRPASHSPTARPSRPTSSSRPTASTPSFGLTSSRRRSRCSTAPFRTAASSRCERLPDWPMDRWETWAGPAKHFLVFPVRHGTMINYVGFVPADEEMKKSWSAPGNPDVLRAEFEGWDPRIASVLQAGRHLLPLGAVRPRAAADLDQGAAHAARRRRASDAAASRPGREPVDRGRHGAGDDPGARRPGASARPRCWPMSGCAASASPTFSSARARTGCGSIQPTRISRCATPSSSRTRNSASGSTRTTWCRMRRRRRWRWGSRDADRSLGIHVKRQRARFLGGPVRFRSCCQGKSCRSAAESECTTVAGDRRVRIGVRISSISRFVGVRTLPKLTDPAPNRAAWRCW